MGLNIEGEISAVAKASADMHIGGTPGALDAFHAMVEAAKHPNVHFLILNGDIFDKSAKQEHVDRALNDIQEFLAIGGKQVIFVPGNHEERMKDPPWEQVKQRLQNVGVLFLEPENPRIELEFPDSSGVKRKIALVGMSAVLPREEMDQLKPILQGLSCAKQAARVQTRLEELYFESFKKAIEKSSEEGNDMPTIVVTHAPINIEAYGDNLDRSELHFPGKFAEALNPSTVLLVLHGHLHDGMFPGITVLLSHNGILVINDGTIQDEVDIPLPSEVRSIEEHAQAIRRSIEKVLKKNEINSL